MASHLGLRSLTMSHLWDARLKWVNLQKEKKNADIFPKNVLSLSVAVTEHCAEGYFIAVCKTYGFK